MQQACEQIGEVTPIFHLTSTPLRAEEMLLKDIAHLPFVYQLALSNYQSPSCGIITTLGLYYTGPCSSFNPFLTHYWLLRSEYASPVFSFRANLASKNCDAQTVLNVPSTALTIFLFIRVFFLSDLNVSSTALTKLDSFLF